MGKEFTCFRFDESEKGDTRKTQPYTSDQVSKYQINPTYIILEIFNKNLHVGKSINISAKRK